MIKRIFSVLVVMLFASFFCGAEEGGAYYWNLAVNADKAGEYDKAIEYYGKVVSIGDEPNLVKTAHCRLAEVYHDQKADFFNAKTHSLESLRISLKNKSGTSLSVDDGKYFANVDMHAYSILIECFKQANQYDLVKDVLSKQLELVKIFDGDERLEFLIDICINYCDYFLRIDDMEKSVQYAEEALDYLKRIKQTRENSQVYRLYEKQVYLSLFFSYMYMGDKYTDRLNSVMEKMESSFGENAGLFVSVAHYYSEIKGDSSLAEEYYIRGLEIAKSEYENNGDFASGHELFIIYYSLASFYQDRKDYKRMIDAFDSAEKVGEIIFKDGRQKSVEEYYLGFFLFAERYKYYAKIYGDEKSHNLYLRSVVAELSILEKNSLVGDNYSLQIKVAYDILTSELEWLPDEYAEKKIELKKRALKLGLSAMDMIYYQLPERRSEVMENSVAFYYAAVTFAAEQKNNDAAFFYSESLRGKGFLKEIGNRASLYVEGLSDEEREKIKDFQMQITFDMQTLAEHDNPEIRARMMRNMKSLGVLENQIGKRVPQYERLSNPSVVTSEDAQKWCGKNRVILEYVLWNPDYGKGVYGNMQSGGGLDFSSAMRAKQEPAHIQSYCLVITDKKTEAVPLDSDYDYMGGVKKLRKSLKVDKPKKAASVTLESTLDARCELYDKLIAPVLPYIPKSTKFLVIVPDGDLSAVPFDILSGDDGKILGDRYSISFSPAVSVTVTKDSKPSRNFSLLGIGDAVYRVDGQDSRTSAEMQSLPENVRLGKYEDVSSYLARTFPDGWANIPGTGIQLHYLQDKILSPKKMRLYIGKDASESRIKAMSKSGELASYSGVMFACHGYFDQTYPRASTLVFSETSGVLSDSADDGYLTAEEIAVLKIDADFINMSACLTGLSHQKRGDGMTGLTRSCIVAGADCVGATLWEVDDNATSEFTKILYRKIKSGMSYKDAYKKTKMEFRKSTDFPEPYFWAPFVLYE